jgi:hypothetical protein
MIEFILQLTLFINGLFLSKVGVVYIQSPQKEILQTWGYKNELLEGPGLDVLDILGGFFLPVTKLSDVIVDENLSLISFCFFRGQFFYQIRTQKKMILTLKKKDKICDEFTSKIT